MCTVLKPGQLGCVLTLTSEVQSANSDIQWGALCAYDGTSLSGATHPSLTVQGENLSPQGCEVSGVTSPSAQRVTKPAEPLCGQKLDQNQPLQHAGDGSVCRLTGE